MSQPEKKLTDSFGNLAMSFGPVNEMKSTYKDKYLVISREVWTSEDGFLLNIYDNEKDANSFRQKTLIKVTGRSPEVWTVGEAYSIAVELGSNIQLKPLRSLN